LGMGNGISESSASGVARRARGFGWVCLEIVEKRGKIKLIWL
jgi:hypothetical protein